MSRLRKPKQLYPIVEIVWEDITNHGKGWVAHLEIPQEVQPMLISSVGYLVLDTPDYVVYAADLSADGETNDRTQIPRANVKSIKVLRKVKVEKTPKDVSVSTS